MRTVDRWSRGVVFLAASLLVSAAARAEIPEVEREIARQDEMDRAGRLDLAVKQAREALEEEDTALRRYLLGRAYGLQRKLEEARAQFDWALERDPTFAYAYLGLGIYHMLKGNPREAEKQLRLAMETDPRFVRAHAQLGKLYLLQGDGISAEQEFLEVLKYAPGHLEVRALLAELFLREKRYRRAEQEFRAILARSPREQAARKGLALALMLQRKPDEAIREFEKVIAGDPKDYESYVFLKKLQEGKGDREGEKKTLRRLIAAAPEGSRIRKDAQAELDRLEKGLPAPPRAITLRGLLAKLDSKDVEERRRAMRVLVDLEIVPTRRRMVEMVRDPDKVMRTLAVRNLANTGGRNAIPLLEMLLVHEKDRDRAFEVRGAAAAGLTRIGSPAAVPVLLRALSDESGYVFRLVVEGLRKFTGQCFLGDPEAPIPEEKRAELVRAWRAWWRGPRALSVKLDAIDDLQDLKVRRLALYLVLLLQDPQAMVARWALEAFEFLTRSRIGDGADLATAEGRKLVRRRAEAVLRKP